ERPAPTPYSAPWPVQAEDHTTIRLLETGRPVTESRNEPLSYLDVRRTSATRGRGKHRREWPAAPVRRCATGADWHGAHLSWPTSQRTHENPRGYSPFRPVRFVDLPAIDSPTARHLAG